MEKPELTSVLIAQVAKSFDAHSIGNFRRFISRNSRVRNWIVTSDYNWGTPGRPHDLAVFTILSGEAMEPLTDALTKNFAADFKKIRTVPPEAVEFFRKEAAAFHICFQLNKSNALFQGRVGGSRLEEARFAIEEIIKWLKPTGSRVLPNFERFRQKSRSNSFHVNLFENVILLSILYAFIVGLLTREGRPKPSRILWCSDRDRLTTWADGILWSFAFINAFKWSLQFGWKYENEQLPMVIMSEKGSDAFDPLIRPPDYLAGALSSWSLDRNAGMEGAPKYGQVLRDIVAGNANISLHRIQIDDVIHVTNWQVGLT